MCVSTREHGRSGKHVLPGAMSQQIVCDGRAAVMSTERMAMARLRKESMTGAIVCGCCAVVSVSRSVEGGGREAGFPCAQWWVGCAALGHQAALACQH
jgi:hypothetical protein